jgi:uracil-DNA glycosylase family 4
MARAASRPQTLAARIVACERCPRLREHCAEVARVKRRAYEDEEYWGRPVPTFGVSDPRLLVVGLAPGAHGANRTGRVFTGDSSGDWLYRALFEAGFATQPDSLRPGDGLELIDAAVSCAVRCAPPGNKPLTSERDACRPWLEEELREYRGLRVLVALGRFAFDSLRHAWPATKRAAWPKGMTFAHGAMFHTEDARICMVCSYHPSRQNTQTGRLTREMFDLPFRTARTLLDEDD